MGSLARHMRRRMEHRRRNAEEQAFRILERRWRDELRGQPIPPNFRSRMRRDPLFQQIVDTILEGEPIAFEDRDLTPDVVRRPDGTVRSRMEEELGGDPAAYLCPDCDEPVSEPGPCEPCRTYTRRTI